MIHIGGKAYELVEDHKNGWNPVAFRDRYSDILDRYDYIIGDWGYNQLRLKGFFRDNHPKATSASVISGLVDYINEYCNFGCAYFVLQKHAGKHEIGRDDLDLDTLAASDPEEGKGEHGEETPVAAAQAAEQEEKPPLREHIRAVPKAPQRRQNHNHAQRNKGSQQRDQEEREPNGSGGGQPSSQQSGTGRKTHPSKEREKDKDSGNGNHHQKQRQSGGQEKQRQKKQNHAMELGKAQTAAAAEQSSPKPKDKQAHKDAAVAAGSSTPPS